MSRQYHNVLFIIGWVWLAATWIMPSAAWTQKLFTRSYSAADGLPHNRVLSIHQDNHGYLWFGTPGGATRYDGWSFDTYTTEHGLRSPVVNAIYESSDGVLWLGTDDGFCYFDVRADSFVSNTQPSELSTGTVRSILEDAAGNVWFATASGLWVRDAGTHRYFNFGTRDGLPSSTITALARSPGKAVFAGTSDGISEITYANRSIRVANYSTRDGLINNRIESLCLGADQSLWIGTGVGLSRLEGSRFINFSTSSGLPGNSIMSIVQGSDGVWLATTGGIGHLRTVNNRIEIDSYTARDGLGTNQFNCVYEDREGTIWFGTLANGAIKLLSEDIRFFTEKDGLPSENIHSISLDPVGRTWIGTADGLALWDNGRILSYRTSEGLVSSNIWDVAADRSGVLWIGTYLGLQVLVPRNLFSVHPHLPNPARVHQLISSSRPLAAFYSVNLAASGPLSGHFVPDVCVDHRQDVWVSIADVGIGRIIISPSGEWSFRLYTRQDGLVSLNGSIIVEDRHQRIWIGFSGGGLALYDSVSDRFHTFSKSNGLPDHSVMSLAEDSQGDLWIGSQGGLTELRTSQLPLDLRPNGTDLRPYLTTLTIKQGLSDHYVNSITVDALGYIWAGTNKGLNYVDPVAHSVIKVYRKRHGLPDNEIGGPNAMMVDATRRIWIGSRTGILRMPIETTHRQPNGIKAYIKSFLVENKTERTSRLVRVGPALSESDSLGGAYRTQPDQPILYQENNVLLEFVAPSFREESDVTFSYRLVGFENEWSRPTADNKVRYTNLDAGEYAFQVKACDGSGVWSRNITTVRFTIETPFWQSWWFMLFSLTFVGLSIYTTYQFRISLVHQRTSELEEKVLHRTRELVKRKETLERVLAELKETQLHLIHSEKMASLGQLVAGIAHEINNPITYVKANISILEKKVSSIDQVFHEFSELFDSYEVLKSRSEPELQTVVAKLEAVDRLISTTRFEEFLTELPMVVHEMRDGVERTQKIVEDLRNFSRLDESQFKEILITDCVDSTLNILKNEYKSRVRIHRNYGPVPPIHCNPGHINQVIMNLLSNAFHAIEGEGDVWIRTSAGNNNILISIRDNGRGIPYAVQNKVFDPFFTTKSVGKGTGLGLSISYKIIENHKGTIFFESQPGKGTEFKITLPIRRAN